jgi:branched-chain amino acid transport system substrate-binding protein
LRKFSVKLNRAISKLHIITVIAVIVIAGIAIGLYMGLQTGPKGPEEVVIGAAIPLSGTYAREGLYIKAGYEMAVEEFNEKGGVYVAELNRKLPIRLIIYDDKSDKATTTSLTEHLITVDHVHAVLGSYGTVLCFGQCPIVEKYRIPYVTGGAGSLEIFQQGYRYVFGTIPSLLTITGNIMDFLKWAVDQGKLSKPVKIANAYENTVHGAEHTRAIIEKSVEHKGYFEVVLNEPFEVGATDFRPLLSKINLANADVLLVDARLSDYITMHRQYVEMGLYHKVVSYALRGPEATAREALGAASDYLISCQYWDKRLPYPQVKEWVEKFEAKYGLTAEWYGATTYEACRAILFAIEKAGSLNPEKIRDALAELDEPNSILLGGRLNFGPLGQHIYTQLIILQNVPGGKTEIIWPPEAATAEPVIPMPQK